MGPDKGSNWGSNNTAGQWLRQSEKNEIREVFFISWQVFAMIETREAIENLDSILDLEVITNFQVKNNVLKYLITRVPLGTGWCIPGSQRSLNLSRSSHWPRTSQVPIHSCQMACPFPLFLCCPFHNNNFLFGTEPHWHCLLVPSYIPTIMKPYNNW